MNIGILHRPYLPYGDQRYERMQADGFTCCDYNIMDLEAALYTCPLEEFDRLMKEEKRLADAAGIRFSQIHGPCFGAGEDDALDWENRLTKCRRALRGAALLGSPCMVLHPIMHSAAAAYGGESLQERNQLFLQTLLPDMERYGVTVCMENMPMKWLKEVATPAEMLQLVERVNHPLVQVCLDTGHSIIWGVQPGEAVRLLGTHLRALHVHDNDGVGDSHAIPFYGVGRWDDFASALQEVGFAGSVSLEAEPSYRLSDPARSAFLRAMALTARQLAGE